jgi:hypothetical protein
MLCGTLWVTSLLASSSISVGQSLEQVISEISAAAETQQPEELPSVAVISGPSTAPGGELVVLSSARSVGVSYVWIIPEDKAKVADGCGGVDSQVFFATSIPGTYQFILVVSDKDAKLTYAIHHVTIPGADGVPPIDDEDPIQPPPVDVEPGEPDFGRYNNLFRTSQMNSKALNDQYTREALHTSLTAAIGELRPRLGSAAPPTLDALRTKFAGTIEDVLLLRQAGSRDIEWEQGWRVPNNQWLAQENPTTPQDYFQAMIAITAGLK